MGVSAKEREVAFGGIKGKSSASMRSRRMLRSVKECVGKLRRTLEGNRPMVLKEREVRRREEIDLKLSSLHLFF